MEMSFIRRLSSRGKLYLIAALTVLSVHFGAILWIDASLPRILISDISLVMLGSLAFLALLVAARKVRDYDRQLSTVWYCFGLAQLFWTLGDLGWLVMEPILHIKPHPSLIGISYFLYYVAMIVGILRYPTASDSRLDWYKRVLDAGIVVLSTVFMVWTLILGPLIRQTGNGTDLSILLSIGASAGDALVLWGFLVILFRQQNPVKQLPLVFMAIGTILQIVTDILFGYQTVLETYQSGMLLEFAWAVGFVVVGIAGIIQYSIASRNTETQGYTPAITTRLNSSVWRFYLPYLWMSFIFLALIWSHFQSSRINFLGLALCVGVILGLSFLRRILTFSENTNLTRQLSVLSHDLEQRVQERTNELTSANVDLQKEVGERKQVEIELRKTNRALHIISTINQGLARSKNIVELLDTVCWSIVDIGGYPLVWIGFLEDEGDQNIYPVVQAGYGDGALEKIYSSQIGVASGPIREAVSLREPIILRDLTGNEIGCEWCKAAVERGARSCAILPLTSISGPIGVLCVCSKEIDLYDAAEISFLSELCDHVAYGIMTLKAKVEHTAIEAALVDSEKRYQSLYEGVPVGLYRIGEDGRFLETNPALVKLLGYPDRESLIRQNTDVLFQNIDRDTAPITRDETDRVKVVERKIRRFDGTSIWVRDTAHVVRDPDGQILYIEGSLIDIQDQFLAEESEHEQRMLAEAFRDAAESLAGTLNLDEVLDRILDNIQRVVPHDASDIILIQNSIGRVVRHRGYIERGIGDLVSHLQVDINNVPNFRRIYETGQACLIDNVQEIDDWVDLEGEIWQKSYLGVPIRFKGEFLGILNLNSEQQGFFTAEHARRLGAFADQAAMAIYNARSYNEAQKRGSEFQALYETTLDLAAQQDLRKLLDTIVEHVTKLCNSNSGFIYLYDPVRGDLVLSVESGNPSSVGFRMQLGQGMAGKVALNRQPMIVDNYSTWEESVPGSTVGETTAVVEVPMVYGGDLIGVLGVQEIGTTDRKFTQEDVHILNLFAAQAANAVHNAHLFEETNLRATQFEQLYEAGLTLNIVLDSQAQLKILFTTAKDALGADRAQYYRYDAANNDFQLELSFGDGYHTTDILVNLRNSKTDGIDLFSWIAKHRRSVNLNSTYEDALVKLRSSGIYSGLFVPIEYNQQLLGLFSLFSSRSNAFNAHDERLVTLFANQAAVAMENTRLLSQAQRRLTHVQALRDIDIAIAGSVDLRVTLNVVLERVTSQLQVDAANILLYNPRLQVLEYATSHGFRTRALQGTRMRLDEGYAGKAALERHIVHVPDLRESRDGFERSPHLPSEGFVTYFAVPLIAKGQVKGVLEIFHRSQLDSDQEWLDFLEALAGQAALAIDNVALYENLQRSNTDLGLAYDATIEGWSHALDLRDKETEGHTQRVSEMTIHLARRMGVSEERLVHIQRGSLLHDIGKVGVPDSILFKPGPLTKEEWDIMHMHPVYAFELLSPIAYLRPALEIPYSHHEKWDGTGYPHGLAGEQIPLAARIFAVTDVWDALSSDRPYRRAWERTNVIEYVREQSGKHFDPDVVDVFLQMLNEIGYTKDQEIPEAAMPVWSLR